MMATPALWTVADVLTALDCKTCRGRDDWAANGVSIDTRTLEVGDIFFALSGPNFDAHDFVAQAFEKGAVCAVVTRDPGTCSADAPLLVVDDVTAALQQLAIAARDRLQGKIIAVTGSVGKTGTKEMLRLGCGALGRTVASTGNLNNHWGLPLSLCRVPADTEFTVVEIGMNHPGEIRSLVKIARPHVAIITAIEAAHTEYFTSIDAIADAKAEIFEGVEPGGAAVINHDSPYFERLAIAARDAGINRIIGFGQSGDVDVMLLTADMTPTCSMVKAAVHGVSIHYRIGAPGLHVVKNSLVVLAAIDAIGGDIRCAANALEQFTPLKGRGQFISVELADGAFLLIDESYNASPASMRAAMAVAGRNRPGENGRRIAVLGDMLELGDSAPEEHRTLITPLQENAFDLVFTAGQYTQYLWDELPGGMRGGHSTSPDKLSLVVASAVRAGDVVMVKGSLGSRVGVVIEALSELDQSHADEPLKIVNGN